MVVPPVATMMVKSPQSGKYRLDHLRNLMVGGAPLKADVEDQLLSKYPRLQLRQGISHTRHVRLCNNPFSLWQNMHYDKFSK